MSSLSEDNQSGGIEAFKRVVKFQIDLRGGLLYYNLIIFRLSICAFPITGFRESRADQR